MVTCAPSTVNVPAVTGVANPAVPIVTPLTLPPGARTWLILAVPLIWAAVASCEILKVKLPIEVLVPVAAVATAALDD